MPNWQHNAVQDLREYNALSISLLNIITELKEIEISMTSTNGTAYDKSPIHGGGSGYEDRAINYIDRKGRARERYKIAHLRVERIERGLETLTENERLVLQRFYIDQGSNHVDRLCEELGYERSQVYRIKDCALKKFTLAMFGVVDI